MKKNLLLLLLLTAFTIQGNQFFSDHLSGDINWFILSDKIGLDSPTPKKVNANIDVTERPHQHKAVNDGNQNKSTNSLKKLGEANSRDVSIGQKLLPPTGPVSATVDQSYSLSVAAKTSAGVFDGDVLIRTLWSNEQTNAGTHSLANVWDGKDDGGNYAPDKSYTIKVVSSNATYEWLKPIGNTSNVTTGSGVYHSHQLITCMAQAGSSMYFGVGYNEVGDTHGKFAIGTPNTNATTLKAGGQVIRYLASDGKVVYSAGQRGSEATFITGVIPTQPGAGIETLASFSAGTQNYTMQSGSNFLYSAFDISTNYDHIMGLAVQQTGTKVLSCHPASNQLKVFNKTTGAFITTNAILGAAEVAFQNDSNLWLIYYPAHTGSTTVTQLSGTPTPNPGHDDQHLYDKAFDNNNVTYYWGAEAFLNNVGLQLSGLNVVTKVTLTAPAGETIIGTIEGDNGAITTVLASVTVASGQTVDYTISNLAPFKNIRVYSSNGDLKVAGFKAYGYAYSGVRTVGKFALASDGTINVNAPLIQLTALDDVQAIAVSPDGSKIATAERGSYHKVRFWNTSTGALISTLGRNETYSNPTIYSDKFYFRNVKLFRENDYGQTKTFLAYQSDGTLWVNDYGNFSCKHFDANNNYIEKVQYLGYVYDAQVDINNPTRIFTDYQEFALDYSTNEWTHIRNWSHNVQLVGQFNTDRLRSVVTLSNNRTYAIYNNNINREIIELLPTTGIRHTGVLLETGNNNELFSDGSVWQIGDTQLGQPTFWKRKALTGFDGSNNPLWGSYTNIETSPTVTANDPVTAGGGMRRNQQLLNGAVATFSSDNDRGSLGHGYHLGALKNGAWQFKTSPVTHAGYYGDFPPDGYYDIGNGVNNAGSFMQVVDKYILWGYTGEFWKGSQTNMYNIFLDNGLMVGQFGVSTGYLTRQFSPESVAGDAGNALSGTVVKVGSDIHLFHADEGQHSGVHHWKVSNLSSIQEFSVPVVKSASTALPAPAYIDLMASVPVSGSIAGPIGRLTLSPAPHNNGSDRWVVTAGRTTYKKGERSVRFESRPVVDGVNRDASFDLAVNNGVTNNLATWRITGVLQYPELGEPFDNLLDVLDNTGKVIVRISRPLNNGIISIKINSTTIVQGDNNVMKFVLDHAQPFSISRAGSNILVKFGSYPEVSVSPFETGASLSGPTSLRLRQRSDNTAGHVTDLANLKFYTTSTAVAGTGTGLAGEYFNNRTLTAPAATVRTDSTVNFNWGLNSPIVGTINADNFSVRWSGQVQAPVSGTYVFSTSGDDGMRLWVNGVQVINNWANHNTIDNSPPIELTAGQKYDVKVEYNEGSGGASMRLMWAYAGQGQQVVPKPYLYPVPVPTPVTPSANQAPRLVQAISAQSATVGQPFSLAIPQGTFTDPEGQPLTYTMSGLSPGLSFSGSTLSGTPTTTGQSSVTLTATDPANLQASTSFMLTVSVPTTPTPPPTTGFVLAGVTTVRCETISVGQRRVTFTPQYSGLNGQPVSFSVVNLMLPTTKPGPYTLAIYTDNPTITLRAQQGDTPVSYAYSWLAACNNTATTPPNNTPSANQAPRLVQAISAQSATVGQPFSLAIPQGTFTDPEGQPLTYTMSGLSPGLSFSGSTLSGTPTTTGQSSVTLTATDPANLQASTSFMLTVSVPTTPTPPPTTGFVLAGVTTVRCETISVGQRRVTFTPQYSGLNGQPVSFSVVNLMLPTTKPGPYTLAIYTDNPTITLRAQQGDTPVSYAYSWLAACNNTATTTTPPIVAGTGTGLAGEYFNNRTLTAPAATVRTDSTVNFNWGLNSPIVGTINADNFSVRWSGQVQAPVSGTYVFSTSGDDGMRLWVNGVQVINNWANHNTIDNSPPIELTAGQKYDVKVEYNEGSGGASMRLMWAYAGQGQQVVPKPYLYPATVSKPSGGRIGNAITENAEWLNDVKLFPVPAYDNLWIQYYAQDAGDLVVKLITVTGQPILISAQRVKQGENTLKIPVKELTRGVYMMNLTQDYRQVTRRVILSDQ